MIVYLAAPDPLDGGLYEFGGLSFCNAFKVGTLPDGNALVAVLTDDEQGQALKALPEYQTDSPEALAELYPAVEITSLTFLLQDPA